MFTELFFTQNPAQAIIVLSLCIVLGLLIGKIRLGTISLGVGGVLFSGIAIGHFGFTIDNHVLHFAKEFGLILFVYSIGMQVGPNFLESLKNNGIRLNLLAAFIVISGTIISGLCFIVFDIPLAAITGLYSGAVTNTPSLAASTAIFSDVLSSAPMTAEYLKLAGLGYAAAYPFGILGIILSILLVRFIFKVDIDKENQTMEDLRTKLSPKVENLTVSIVNEAIIGKRFDEVHALKNLNLVFSRIEQMKGVIKTPKADTILTKGTLLLAVGPKDELEKLLEIAGKKSKIDLQKIQGGLQRVDLTVTKDNAVGKTLKRLQLHIENGIVPTRVIRSGFEFTAHQDSILQLGDTVRIVADINGIDMARKTLGDAPRMLDHPHVIPLFIAIFLGIILGSIPVHIPGLPSALKLGIAGGPLLVAIMLSRRHKIAGMVCTMTPSASLMVREIGISLFLATVGLNAGPGFVPMMLSGSGLYWMSIGAIITFVPLMSTALFAWMVLKCNYPTICGLLAGSMTDPPALAFAGQILGSDSATPVYATVYPLTMILRILSAQLLVLFLFHYSS